MNDLVKYTYKDHFADLKKKLWYILVFFVAAFLLSYSYKEEITSILVKPLLDIKKTSTKVIYTAITEAFVTYLELSLFSALLLSLPFASYQMYCFIAPGLYKYEKKVARILFVLAPVLFLLACIFVYFLVIPTAWTFFLNFESIGNINILFEAKISEYLHTIINLMTAFGIAFELPVILIILFLLKIVTLQGMIRKRRIAIVINFILAGILTPPDILSQFMLAIPMCLLYEVAIMICKKLINGNITND